MSSFTNLLSRLDVISEAKVSPMDKILPGFQSQARLLAKDKGASSGTREGRLAMLAILFDLDIIDEAVVRMFKNDPSVSRMVDYFETNGISAKIREKADDINDHIMNQLENKISFTTGNRTDDAQQRYEVNKLSNELKAAKKAARIEKKKETASAMADIVQTIDRYDDLVSSIEGSYSDKYMLEIVASMDSELEDIAKIVSYIGRFTSDKDIDVDGRSIDVVFSANSKLGRIVSKMGANTVERKIADDLKAYGGAGVVIHEPDTQQSKEMVSLLKKAPVEDEEGNEFTQDPYSADYADDYADPYGPVEEEEGDEFTQGVYSDDNNSYEEEEGDQEGFDSLAKALEGEPQDPEIVAAHQRALKILTSGKQVNENASSTAYYLNEQTKRDSHTHVVKEKAVSFREKYSPKTHWQLAELRSYGL